MSEEDDGAAWETVQHHQHHHPRHPTAARRTQSSSLAQAAAATGSSSNKKKTQQQQQQRNKSLVGGENASATTTTTTSTKTSSNSSSSRHNNKNGGGPPPRTNSAASSSSSSRQRRGPLESNSKSGRGGGGRGNLGRSHSTPVTPNSSSPKKGNKTDKPPQPQSSSRRSSSSTTHSASTKLLSEIVLWQSTGMGATPQEQAVLRYSADNLLEHRMRYVDAPARSSNWTPHDRCRWKSSNRLQLLEQQQAVVYNFKPLQTNEETRWKPKSRTQAEIDAETATLDAIQAILNKLSWTNLDKLTNQFLVTLREKNSSAIPPAIIQKVMAQVVQKAMREPHFAPLYARLSVKLAQFHKTFKKILLSQCEDQFAATGAGEQQQQQQSSSTSTTTPDSADTSSYLDKEQTATLSSKRGIGLMTFIGELYVQQLLKAPIVLSCLKLLLIPDDEERLESFCKLMTTTGRRLHLEDDSLTAHDAELRQQLWDTVYQLAGHAERAREEPPVVTPHRLPSTRLKFLLQALIELQDHDWVPIRHEHEKAQTIQEIHQQAAREAQQGPVTRTASTLKRSQSSGLAGSSTPQAQRRSSTNSYKRSVAGRGGGGNSSDEDNNSSTFQAPQQPPRNSLRRVQSESVATTAFAGNSSLQKALRGDIPAESSAVTKAIPNKSNPGQQPPPQTKQQHMDPNDCADKFKIVLKEFFISGDRDDAVLSVDEMVAVGRPGHLERGAAIVEAGILLVLERKESDVRKFIDLVAKLLDDNKLDRACLVKSLRGDALEFLRDIEIDAPLASQYLAVIVAAWLTKKVDDGETALPNLQFLLQAPAYFISDGRPAAFACQVLRERNKTSGQESVVAAPDEWQLVEKLMSEAEKQEFGTPQNFWQAQQPGK